MPADFSNNHKHEDADFYPVGEGVPVHPKRDVEPGLLDISVSRAIFRLAWPAMTSMMLLMIFALVDIWWIGRVSADAVAGVSAASFIYWALEALATLVSTGVNAMVARYVGAKDPNRATIVATQGFILSILLALVLAVGGLATQSKFFEMMGLKAEVLQVADGYMTWIFYGLVVIYLTFSLDGTFRGMGDTKTILKIVSAVLLINAALDPFFILGWGPFPTMGAAGAAIATVIAHALAVVFAIAFLQRREVRLTFSKTQIFGFETMWRIARIGAPIAFSGFVFSLTYMFITRIISDFGTAPLAALGLGHRFEGIAYFACVGFSVAAATLVGQNLGARRPSQAAKSAWLTMAYISILLMAVSVTYFLFAESIYRFFISNPAVVEEGGRYLRIIAIFELFLGCEVVLEGAFGGAGNSLPPMIVSVPLTAARIPLAYILAYSAGLGSNGVWWAISLTTGLKGILMAIWFKQGKWKTQDV